MQLSLFAPVEKKTPTLVLNNIEFLCLKMHANPGKSARWYLRELHRYRFGSPGSGSWNAVYMSPSGGYRGWLFKDTAPKNREARGWMPKMCSSHGEFRLTDAGLIRAQLAAAKIGLSL